MCCVAIAAHLVKIPAASLRRLQSTLCSRQSTFWQAVPQKRRHRHRPQTTSFCPSGPARAPQLAHAGTCGKWRQRRRREMRRAQRGNWCRRAMPRPTSSEPLLRDYASSPRSLRASVLFGCFRAGRTLWIASTASSDAAIGPLSMFMRPTSSASAVHKKPIFSKKPCPETHLRRAGGASRARRTKQQRAGTGHV